MRTTNVNQKGRGFTLVELLIVIIIIAVLAAIAIPKFSNATEQSKEASLHSDLTLYRNAVESYKNDTGVYPNSLADLAATSAPASGWNPTTGLAQSIAPSTWKGPYLLQLEYDPCSTGGALYPAYAVTGSSSSTPPIGTVSANSSDGGTSQTDSQGVAFSTY